ncbi:MAG: adenosylcobinamide-phosphate synthase CbiB [Symbiobacteriia bacterium]
MIAWWQLPAAVALDLLVGDPPWLPHPVVIIGRAVSLLERRLRPLAVTPRRARMAGIVLTLTTVAGTYGVTWGLLALAGRIAPWLGTALETWLLATALAARGLDEAAGRVSRALRGGDLPAARQFLSHLVGRDTDRLDAREVARGVVESVAENTSDGVVAPLLFGLLGGAPLALAYKAVNTLDSMVGYKDERYLHLGWASARLDDLANLIPARLSGLLLVLAAGLSGHDWRRAWLAMWRDAPVHPSPNGGYPEGAVAGALGIRLGGLNYYHGKPEYRAVLGADGAPCTPASIPGAVRLMYLAVGCLVLVSAGVLYLVRA